MTLFSSIYKKIASQSNESLRKYSSPPPEMNEIVNRKHKKRKFLYSHVKARVDSSPPYWSPITITNKIEDWQRHLWENYINNIQLVIALKRVCLEGGKVECRRHRPIYYNNAYIENRTNTHRRIQRDNKFIYKLLKETQCKVVPTKSLQRQWKENKRLMVEKATTKFVLFPITPKEDVEDSSFIAPAGIKRPRVILSLRTRGGAVLGSLTLELFSDICPRTCQLFTELLNGDTLGYGYVGTQFFRKVPQLYWCGGDVVDDSGYGCYAQRGRRMPIGAENYHLSHSMPGLVSMCVTADNEVCGIFTITFKPLPQLDLKNVVFGRVVRPSRTFEGLRTVGSALSTYPHIEISSTKRRVDGVWIHGTPNSKIPKPRV